MSVDLNKYINIIDAVISTANPDEISPKKIRKAIQELFGVNLNEQRKELNDLILDRFNDLQDNPKVLILEKDWEESQEVVNKYSIMNANAEKVVRKSVKSNSSTRVTKIDSKGKKKGKKKNDGEGAKKGISARQLVLSEKLQAILGVKESSRTQVVKELWAYIKEHHLQNPNNGREIICDEKMAAVFGKKIDMFKLHKVLSDHLFNPEELKEH